MSDKPSIPKASPRLRLVLTVCYALPVIFVLGIVGYLGWRKATHQGPPAHHLSDKPFASVPIQGLTANLFTGGDQLRASGNDLFIEFRDARSNLVDVGDVTVDLKMNMPDMVMHTIGKVFRTGTPGQYRTTIEPQMAGDWTGTLTYSNAQARGETNFSVKVQ